MNNIENIQRSDILRFYDKVIIADTGCWEWRGSMNWGYARMRFGKVIVQASRFSYSAFNGAIPEGLTLDHACKNTRCVRYDHLEPVTQYVNNHRAKAWTTRSAKTECIYGHPLLGDNLYVNPGSGKRKCRQCAAIRDRKYKSESRPTG